MCAVPMVVTKGQTITMTFDAPGVELTAMGRAMSEGGIGDTVTVQNPASFRMITAIVTARRHRARHRPDRQASANGQQHPAHRPQIGSAMRKSLFQDLHRWLLLGSALAGCSAVDRIENIGAAPKLAPVGNPADTQIVAAIPAAAADQPCRQFPVAARRAQLLPRSPRHPCRRCDHRECLGRRCRQAVEHHHRSRTNSDDANLTNFFGLENALPKSMDPGSLVKMGSDNSNVGAGAHRPFGSHQPDPGGAGRPGVAQRQSGDLRPSAGAGQQRNARSAGLRHRAHRRHHQPTIRWICRRSPKPASPMAARAR